MRFRRSSQEKQFDQETPGPAPELQIVQQTPEITRIPGDVANMNIGEFLDKQDEIDKQKKEKEKPGLNS